eukprot:CAMPEP_0171278914 /NCGR_PEP_ID=MMETSP0790-20130122/65116_1 /TAXON_ID=2925 /ORGANISM="Alexandrium catenella, Strain OF101" /LENGTH=287 /DNA_ID=CAMNT_0011748089 /DNA_START=27 /DNA_END=889 /DNA_ORIENTATION=+
MPPFPSPAYRSAAAPAISLLLQGSSRLCPRRVLSKAWIREGTSQGGRGQSSSSGASPRPAASEDAEPAQAPTWLSPSGPCLGPPLAVAMALLALARVLLTLLLYVGSARAADRETMSRVSCLLYSWFCSCSSTFLTLCKAVVDRVDVLVTLPLVLPEHLLVVLRTKARMRLWQRLRVRVELYRGVALRKRSVRHVLPLLSPRVKNLRLQPLRASRLKVAASLLPKAREVPRAVCLHLALDVLLVPGRRRPPGSSKPLLGRGHYPRTMIGAHIGRRLPTSLRRAVEVP